MRTRLDADGQKLTTFRFITQLQCFGCSSLIQIRAEALLVQFRKIENGLLPPKLLCTLPNAFVIKISPAVCFVSLCDKFPEGFGARFFH